VSDAFGAFLAGFIEGEGSFLILRQSRGQNHRCSMRLAAREDDDPLIRGIARATAIGEYAKPGPRSPVYARLHELRLQLAEVRAYSPPRPS